MTHPNKRQDEIDKHARRARVAELVRSGVRNQQEIADVVKVNRATISRDLKALEAEWKEQAVMDVGAAKALDLERIDRMIEGVYRDATRGVLGAVDRMLALLKRRADIIGYDAKQLPVDVNLHHSGSVQVRHLDLSQFSNAEIEALAAVAERVKADAPA